MDNKFSAAIHALCLIARSEKPVTSGDIARSVGTNASYIRKILGLLKKRNIVESRRGVGGVCLRARCEELTLLKIYQAVNETDRPRLFDLHRHPSDLCRVGRHIGPVLHGMFSEMEDAFAAALAGKTLADCLRLLPRPADA